ncbi:diguanylate cyclase [Vibrio vulnificus]|nr:diguanylate cyclase [Vibrio vulnificus]EGR8990041.1 diguanylate cyclase [Vibrio vulnificus]EHD1694946.1 diguanylate cyclase [Vibrio vulnificus]EHI9272837.1 diguanylate cyclase [Vibrio vulnificus]OZS53528.1 diguanylate cyclase [Vibrio vulnificus]
MRMDKQFAWIAHLAEHYGAIILMAVLGYVVVRLLHLRYQRELDTLILDLMSPVLLVDLTGQHVLLANSAAMQQLGVRQLNRTYLFPATFAIEQLSNSLTSLSGRQFSQLAFAWQASEHEHLDVALSGRKVYYRGQHCWLLNIQLNPSNRSRHMDDLDAFLVAQSALDSLSELICLKDNDGKILATNRAFELFWEGRRDEAIMPESRLMKGRQSERRWTTDPQGRSCLLEVNQSLLMTKAGEPIGTLSISHDVTEWHAMQQNLRDEMERRKDTEVALAQRDTILQNILEASPDSIGIFNENLVYQACNEPFVRALGIADVNDLIGKRLQDVVPGDMYQRLSVTDSQVLHEGKSLRYIDKVLDSNGEYAWYDVVKSPFRDPASGTNGVLIMARDISERYLAEQKLEAANLELEKLSFMDSLTQVSNRRRFDEQLNTLWFHHAREKLPLTIMLCDIDFFKEFNDRYGHQAGDEALIQVATVFSQVVSRSSDCVARYGGEEFALLLPNTTAEGALKVAEKIHTYIAESNIAHQGSKIAGRVTISIGLVSYIPSPEDVPDMGVALADSALYQAKSDGRNRTCVHPISLSSGESPSTLVQDNPPHAK